MFLTEQILLDGHVPSVFGFPLSPHVAQYPFPIACAWRPSPLVHVFVLLLQLVRPWYQSSCQKHHDIPSLALLLSVNLLLVSSSAHRSAFGVPPARASRPRTQIHPRL